MKAEAGDSIGCQQVNNSTHRVVKPWIQVLSQPPPVPQRGKQIFQQATDGSFHTCRTSLEASVKHLEPVCINVLKFTSCIRRTDDSQKNSYLKRMRYACSFALQEIEKRKAENDEDLIIGKEPIDQLLSKSKEQVARLGWVKTQEEMENLIAEEEMQEGKKT